jgi:glycosyltransferase involved in cell wall biosynthesis
MYGRQCCDHLAHVQGSSAPRAVTQIWSALLSTGSTVLDDAGATLTRASLSVGSSRIHAPPQYAGAVEASRRGRISAMPGSAAIFVLPTATGGQQGPVASWVSTAGWASAARRVLGDAWIVTPAGLVEPDDARRRGSHSGLSAASASPWRRRVPPVAKTAIKDVREWFRARRFRISPVGPWRDRTIAFVWQRHELFHTAGVQLARTLAVPSVLFVPATIVWQSKQWGVSRPGWERWLERAGEQPALRGADLVACGSDQVADQVRRCGVEADRILVTPTGVDRDLFRAATDPVRLRQRLGLTNRFVVGWVGSFRGFHALDQAIAAVAPISEAALLLIGDGPEREAVEQLARRRGVQVVCTGTVQHDELPSYLAIMDVALVLARPNASFHYSPLKLAEYLAAGLPVIAPRVPQIAARLTDGVDVVLVSPGDTDALAHRVRRLRDDPMARARIGAAAHTAAADEWSWDHQVHRVLAVLPRPMLPGEPG